MSHGIHLSVSMYISTRYTMSNQWEIFTERGFLSNLANMKLLVLLALGKCAVHVCCLSFEAFLR